MKLRTAFLTAALISLLASLALASHSATIKVQAQVGEWVDVSKEINAGLGFYAILSWEQSLDNNRVVLYDVTASSTSSETGTVRARCGRAGTTLWKIEYSTKPVEPNQPVPESDRHWFRVEVTCLEKDTEK